MNEQRRKGDIRKRIIIHWTGGANQPNSHEYECYHYLVNGDGLVIKGKFKPEDNENCYNGKYAAHTGGGNTGSIGVGLCGMYVPKDTSVKLTKYPLKLAQCEAAFKLVAQLSKQYKIPITPDTVMTHYEFGKKHPDTTSKGKIDIIYLPPYPEQQQDEIGNFIRKKVNWYIQKYYS